MLINPDIEKIKRWREERCWSQEHLADVAGVSLRTIQRLENGETASRDSLMALAAAFNVDVIALTVDPKTEAKRIVQKERAKTSAAVRLSFFIHLASYIFGMLVFAAISASDGPGGDVMILPAIWWSVGMASHGLTVVIVELALHYQQKSEGID